jgi:hypothetical protein
MRFSENMANIASALCKVQAEIKNPIKNQTNKGVQGAPKYANLEDTLSEYVRPVLTKYGMSVFQSLMSDDNGRVGVKTTLLHESGEYIEGDYVFCDIVIPVSKQGNKILTEGQATGVCITYLRRYSLNAALGINGDKDTDGSYTDEPTTDEPLTYETALGVVITFGQYNGQTLSEIWQKDIKYISYLHKNADARIKEAIEIIDAELKKKKESTSSNAQA